MKAITLWQPWASLIAVGVKTSETRSWAAPQSLWGERIAIHAAKRLFLFKDTEGWPNELQDAVSDMIDREYAMWKGNLPLGAVVATARLRYCGQVTEEESSHPLIHGKAKCAVKARGVWYHDFVDHQRHDGLGDYSLGRWVWFLGDVQRILPVIPARGYQGFWEWTPPEQIS